MFGPASERPLASSTASRQDAQAAAVDANDLLRRLTVRIVLAALLVAGTLALFASIRIDFKSFGAASEFAAAMLLGWVMQSRRRSWPKLADVFGALVLAWLCGIVSGLISLIGLQLHFPLVDSQLFAVDRLVGTDTVGLVRLLSHLPWSVMIFVQLAYKFTIPVLFVSMIGLSLLGDRLESWRAAYCFAGSVLSICILSIFTPAKGVGTWLSDADVGALPRGATRYFWRSFDSFYSGSNPTLRLDSIDGVVSFPSFHVAMGLIAVTMWRRWPGALPLVVLWAMGMFAGTLAIGGHYVIDLVGGALIWAGWYVLSLRLAPTENAGMGSKSAIVRSCIN